MVPCTQTPPAMAMGSSKRIRKPGAWSAAAVGGGTMPKTPLPSRLEMVSQQTPMPEPENGYGPPPPDTTPTPQRETPPAIAAFD